METLVWGVSVCPWPVPTPWKALNVLLAGNKIKTSTKAHVYQVRATAPGRVAASPEAHEEGPPGTRSPVGLGGSPLLRNKPQNVLPSALPSTLETLIWDGKAAWGRAEGLRTFLPSVTLILHSWADSLQESWCWQEPAACRLCFV